MKIRCDLVYNIVSNSPILAQLCLVAYVLQLNNVAELCEILTGLGVIE